jgi:hypothetical protein
MGPPFRQEEGTAWHLPFAGSHSTAHAHAPLTLLTLALTPFTRPLPGNGRSSGSAIVLQYVLCVYTKCYYQIVGRSSVVTLQYNDYLHSLRENRGEVPVYRSSIVMKKKTVSSQSPQGIEPESLAYDCHEDRRKFLQDW